MAKYIDREALIKQAIEEKRFVFKMEDAIRQEVVFNTVYKDFADLVMSIPAADVEEVKHGFWMPQILLGERVWDCSECKTIGSPHWKRCPVCEAKMNGGKENERA